MCACGAGRYEENFSNNSVKIFKLILVLMLWLHFDSCMFFMIARWHEMESGEWAPDSWVYMNNLQDASFSKQYLWSLWHVASHMLSVTYGPVNPVRTEEVCATLLSMMCGAALYAGIIGTTASIMQASNPSGSEFYKQWDELKVFMRHKGVPADIRDRLRKYFNARWKGRKIFDEQRIMSTLPEPYVRSLLTHECQFLLRSVNVLEAGGEGLTNALVPLLHSRLILDGETIILEREPPAAWWMISRGVVGLYRNGRKFAELDDGCTFGDVPLLYGVKAPFSVITETPCQFYYVTRADFEGLFRDYPELTSKMKRDAYKKCRRWGLSTALKEAASRGEHASEFVQHIEFDWDAAEAELQAEAASTGEIIEPPENLYEYWSTHNKHNAHEGRYADLFGDAYDPDYDIHNIVGKLRQGFDKAGQVLRRVPQELNRRPSRHASNASMDDMPGSNATTGDPFMHHLRRFGTGVETVFRDPATTFQGVRRGAERFGHQVRDGMRTVRTRISTGVQHIQTRRRGTSMDGSSTARTPRNEPVGGGGVGYASTYGHNNRSSNGYGVDGHVELPSHAFHADNPFAVASATVSHPSHPHHSISLPNDRYGMEDVYSGHRTGHPMLTPIRETRTPNVDVSTPRSTGSHDSDSRGLGVIHAPQLRTSSGLSLDGMRTASPLLRPPPAQGTHATQALEARLRARVRENGNGSGSPAPDSLMGSRTPSSASIIPPSPLREAARNNSGTGSSSNAGGGQTTNYPSSTTASEGAGEASNTMDEWR
jgi:hypothetical protein